MFWEFCSASSITARLPWLPVCGCYSHCWNGCCWHCWCSGGYLSDNCTCSWLPGHLLPTTTHPFPILSSYFYLLQSQNEKGNACTNFGVRRVESWVPFEATETHLPICLPTVPLLLLGSSTSSPPEMPAACFEVSVSHRHYGWCIVILSHIFYCKCAILWLNCLMCTGQGI